MAPPRRSKDQGAAAAAEDEAPKTLYEKLPDSLKSEVLVRSKVEVDEQVLKQRQELTRSMSPAQVRSYPCPCVRCCRQNQGTCINSVILSQLGEIKGLSDFPVPILFKKRPPPPPEQEK